MRAEQLWRWIYHYGVTDFARDDQRRQGTARDAGASTTRWRGRRSSRSRSATDGTRKWLIRLGAGRRSASACSFPDVGRAGALCVSSQVGCTLTCTFCHTGTQKLVRNLTAAEIVAQVMIARDALGEWPTHERPLNDGDRQLTNIVFMGMGEPLYNLDNVATAIDIIADGDGISISRRRITVSTAGVAPKIHGTGRAHRRDAGDLAARDQRRAAQPARAAEQEVQSRRAVRGDPRLSFARQRQARDVRVRDAEGRQRHRCRKRRRW